MFRLLTRSVRPATRTLTARAAFSTSLKVNAHGPPPPEIYGPGAEDGAVPTDYDQATGVQRFQLLGEIEGVDVFDMTPLDSSRVGTLKDPIKVPAWGNDRIIGCTGCPADSHETLWFHVKKNETTRCWECGSAYTLESYDNIGLLAKTEASGKESATAQAAHAH